MVIDNVQGAIPESIKDAPIVNVGEPEEKSELTLGDDELENAKEQEEDQDEKAVVNEEAQAAAVGESSETWSLTLRDEQELEVENSGPQSGAKSSGDDQGDSSSGEH